MIERTYAIYLEKSDEIEGVSTTQVSVTYADLEDAVDELYELSEGDAMYGGLEAEWAPAEGDLPEGVLYLYYYLDFVEREV